MQLAQWIFGIAMMIPAVGIIVGNWMIFARGTILRSKAPSWVPLIGGTLTAAGFLMIPNPLLHQLWWLGLLLDWGSAPGIAFTGAWHIRRLLKRAS